MNCNGLYNLCAKSINRLPRYAGQSCLLNGIVPPIWYRPEYQACAGHSCRWRRSSVSWPPSSGKAQRIRTGAVSRQLPQDIDVALQKARFSEMPDGRTVWELVAERAEYDKGGEMAISQVSGWSLPAHDSQRDDNGHGRQR